MLGSYLLLLNDCELSTRLPWDSLRFTEYTDCRNHQSAKGRLSLHKINTDRWFVQDEKCNNDNPWKSQYFFARACRIYEKEGLDIPCEWQYGPVPQKSKLGTRSTEKVERNIQMILSLPEEKRQISAIFAKHQAAAPKTWGTIRSHAGPVSRKDVVTMDMTKVSAAWKERAALKKKAKTFRVSGAPGAEAGNASTSKPKPLRIKTPVKKTTSFTPPKAKENGESSDGSMSFFYEIDSPPPYLKPALKTLRAVMKEHPMLDDTGSSSQSLPEPIAPMILSVFRQALAYDTTFLYFKKEVHALRNQLSDANKERARIEAKHVEKAKEWELAEAELKRQVDLLERGSHDHVRQIASLSAKLQKAYEEI